ncbi:Formamidopyrimidine-DNA glycosylase [uncultured virus]|nr:Formamidopyrimidine-DNA glycosylase [uncultured virus]
MTILAVGFKGKKLVFHIERADKSMVYLICFLGMEGRFQYTEGDHTGFGLEIGEVKQMKAHTLCILQERVWFSDSRHFGFVKVVSTEAEIKAVFKDTGPDWLNDNITIEYFTAKLRNKRIKDHTIAWYLLERQMDVSGVGNYLRAEILYACAMAPTRKLSELTDGDIQLLYEWTLYIINESYRCNGLTIATYRDPEGVLGTFQPKVYKQKVDPLGNPVVKQQFEDGRTTHWVPAVQR